MTEMDAILRTIREVETSLDRRSARASGVVMMTWGAVAAAIFLLYALADLGVDPVARLDHRVLHWLWAPFIALGYLLTALTQLRLGRMRATEGAASVRKLLLVLLAPLGLLVVAIVTGFGWQLIPAMWVAFLGYTFLAWDARRTRTDRAIGYASLAAALALAVPAAWPWANLAAGAWYAAFLFGRGVVVYQRA